MEDLSRMNEASPLSAEQQAWIVTIDGPAGAGKSSIARRLAERMEFGFLDTGAMYRAVALAMLRAGIDNDAVEIDAVRLAALAASRKIDQRGGRTFLDGEDVSEAIRTNAVSEATRHAADNPDVRGLLVQRQREIAAGRRIVCEGRDQGSVVFPASPCKIYLTATAEERARRRQLELAEREEFVEYGLLLQQINQRDAQDRSRAVGPLVKPDDAIEVHTDGLNIEQVVDRLEAIVRARIDLSGGFA